VAVQSSPELAVRGDTDRSGVAPRRGAVRSAGLHSPRLLVPRHRPFARARRAATEPAVGGAAPHV